VGKNQRVTIPGRMQIRVLEKNSWSAHQLPEPDIILQAPHLDEFTTPVKNLEKKAEAITTNTRNLNIAILACTLILVGFVVSWYGLRLTRKIKYLTDVAERISIGELDTEISLKATDEIGELRDAISRMQDSIRISIERLRQRR